jgi:hypothetical protein
MSTIGVKISNICTDWQNGEQSIIQIKGSIKVDNKKEMKFLFYKDRLSISVSPSTISKVSPELTKNIKTVVRSLLTAYMAAAEHKGQFEVHIENDGCDKHSCALEE